MQSEVAELQAELERLRGVCGVDVNRENKTPEPAGMTVDVLDKYIRRILAEKRSIASSRQTNADLRWALDKVHRNLCDQRALVTGSRFRDVVSVSLTNISSIHAFLD